MSDEVAHMKIIYSYTIPSMHSLDYPTEHLSDFNLDQIFQFLAYSDNLFFKRIQPIYIIAHLYNFPLNFTMKPISDILKFNQRVIRFIINELIFAVSLDTRFYALKLFLKLLKKSCDAMQYNLAYNILFALQTKSSQRMTKTWNLLDSESLKEFNQTEVYFQNFSVTHHFNLKIVTINTIPIDILLNFFASIPFTNEIMYKEKIMDFYYIGFVSKYLFIYYQKIINVDFKSNIDILFKRYFLNSPTYEENECYDFFIDIVEKYDKMDLDFIQAYELIKVIDELNVKYD